MSKHTIVLVGGKGGLFEHYRDIVEAAGLELRYFERHLPARLSSAVRDVALVVVMVGMVSHPLREQAQRLASREHAPIVYLRTASVSAMRKALPSQPAPLDPVATSGKQRG